ncbi:LEA type 2 family protein [Leptospira sp. GIMC2001]|uniref:NDR1/HIN1-like protein n=1 Tax=Leptospira sp. GIMC2001 TaxID=1513297 RepID=UPI002349AC61|nr:LEA type 2 family protein [Leptospira sp. GIMC2001]WCL48067.1 LEA type 2 family protein [Leptospira sp. GIMC2001]
MKTLLISISLFALLGSCSALEKMQGMVPKPQYQFQSLNIKNINLSEITLQMVGSIKNPYGVSLPKSLVGVDLLIEGNRLTHIDTDLGAIEGKATKTVPMDIKLKYSDLLKFYKNFPKKELLNFQMKGDLELPIPANYQIAGASSVKFPIDQSKEIPAVLPDVEIRNFSLKKPDLTTIATQAATGIFDKIVGTNSKDNSPGLEANFDLAFTNKTAAKLLMNQLKFDLELEGQKFLAGSPTEIVQVGDTNIVKIKTMVPLFEAGTSLYSAYTKRSANYKITGISGLSFPSIDKATIPFNYDKLGKLSWR